jgi:hypothetical protein
MEPPRMNALTARLFASVFFALSLVAGCAPAEGTTNRRDDSAAATKPKSITIGVQEEPIATVLYGQVGTGGSTSNRFERWFIFHGNLTVFDAAGNPTQGKAP